MVPVAWMACAEVPNPVPPTGGTSGSVAFTQAGISYQGRLSDGGVPATGSYDFQFQLVDAATGGNTLGGAIRQTFTIQGGVFSAAIPLEPSAFTGEDRWIEVRVRPTPAAGSSVPEADAPYAVLERQRIRPVPYAFRALTSAKATTVESVPVQSLPPSVPLLDDQGRLGLELIPESVARAASVSALGQSLQAENTLRKAELAALEQKTEQGLNQLSNAVASLGDRLAALTQENSALRQSVQVLSAPIQSGWMAASGLSDDPSMAAAGFTLVTSIAPPSWSPVSLTGAPSPRSAAASVWTGQEWIVWGGRIAGQLVVASGARLRPDLDGWTEVTAFEAPAPRGGHTAVWTGTQMIVWGGSGESGPINTGGRYTPQPQGWSSVATVGAPAARSGHGAAWTGRSMVVFGGRNSSGLLGDGALYDPVADRWSTLPTTGAPSPRFGATVLWTGTALLVWGGEGDSADLATGAVLSFGADGAPGVWSPVSTDSAPSARSGHSTAWDGRRLYVWGGRSRSGQILSDGAVWDSQGNAWTALGTFGAPTPRYEAASVWTGTEFAIFGGSGQAGPLATGAAWNPSTATWRPLPSQASSSARSGALSVWTGSHWLVLGGLTASGTPLADPQRLEVRAPWFLYRRGALPSSTVPTSNSPQTSP